MMTTIQPRCRQPGLKEAWLCLMLTACGGGGAPDITGTGDDGSDEGEVSGFGSVIVNGTRYATGSATRVEIEGQNATELSLRLGMVVTVEVPANQVGVDGSLAERIVFRASVDGKVDALDRANRTISVLGLEIVSDELTRFFDSNGNPSTLDGIAVGDVVRVSGFRRANGSVRASYIGERPQRPGNFLVRGQVSALDSSTMQFNLNGLSVDYSQAAIIDPDLEDGDSVEVSGNKSSDGQRFEASRVTELRDNMARPATRGGLRGVVTRIAAGSSCPQLTFAVNDGQSVQTSSTTQYEGGSRCTDIAIDRQVGVFGRYSDNGTLIAERAAIVPDINAFAQAPVEAKSGTLATSADAAPVCTLRVLGDLDIRIDGNTRQGEPESDSAAGNRSFSCKDIEVGDFIAAAGTYRASEKRIDAQLVQPARRSTTPAGFDSIAAAGGLLQSINPGARQFQLLDSLVQISNDTDFKDSSEVEFYAQAQPGDRVAAAGFWDGSALQASVVVRNRIDPSRD